MFAASAPWSTVRPRTTQFRQWRERRADGWLTVAEIAQIDHDHPGFIWDQADAVIADASPVLVLRHPEHGTAILTRAGMLLAPAVLGAFLRGTRAGLDAAIVAAQVRAFADQGVTVPPVDLLTPAGHRLVDIWLATPPIRAATYLQHPDMERHPAEPDSISLSSGGAISRTAVLLDASLVRAYAARDEAGIGVAVSALIGQHGLAVDSADIASATAAARAWLDEAAAVGRTMAW